MIIMDQYELDKKLYNGLWQSQCKEIDTDLLDYEDALLVQKCIHQQDITRTELQTLRKLLKEYRNIDEKYDIKNTTENIETFTNIITSEQEFLNLIDSQEEIEIEKEYTLSGRKHIIKFIINPVLDSRAILDVVEHANLFEYVTEEERKIYDKQNNNQKLTEKEKRILNKLNNKIAEKLNNNDNIITIIDSLLTRQVRLKDSELTTIPEKKEFWSKVDLSIKLDLFNEIKDLINFGDNQLFR